MGKKHIAITIRSFNTNSDYFKKLLEEFEITFVNRTGYRLEKTDLIREIQDVDGVIAGTEHFDKEVLESSHRLKVISRVGVGLDSIDVGYARSRHMVICNTPKAPVTAVSEHTIALILALLKEIPRYTQDVMNGNLTVGSGELLHGKVVGIIGLGRIGHTVACLLECFGSKIIYFDPYLRDLVNIPESWTRMNDLKSVLAMADIITLHATPRDDGSPLFDQKAFSSCKRGIIIINTARESLIDEGALLEAMKAGIVGGIAFDVFNKEFILAVKNLNSKVILTPHVASNTQQSRRDMEREAVLNLIQSIGDQ